MTTNKLTLVATVVFFTFLSLSCSRSVVDNNSKSVSSKSEIDNKKVGFEILKFTLSGDLIVWASKDLTEEEFNDIDLNFGWIKNQPRESMMDSASFSRSPDAAKDGEYQFDELYGHKWMHVATVVDFKVKLDKQGLLKGRKVAKYHTITYKKGRTVQILTSPEEKKYVLVSRDVNRTQEAPTIPEGWVLSEITLEKNWTIELPNPILNIRTDNEDSFQGPIDAY